METQTFQINRGYIIRILLLGLGFVIAGTWGALTPNIDLGARILLASCAAIFGLASLLILRHLFHKGPALVISSEGIEKPLTFSGTIPWTQITNIVPKKVRKNEFLAFTVDKGFAQSVPWRGLMSGLVRRKETFSIPLSQIDGSSDGITRLTLASWQAGRANSSASGNTFSSSINSERLPLVVGAQPLATYGLLALFCMVYICEIAFAVDPSPGFKPSVKTLFYLGGDVGFRVKGASEYWRMFTAPLMHADPIHILFNSLAFWFAGQSLERIVGWKWLLGIFAITALGGEIATNFFLAPNIVGVGASGGIMGILASLFVMAGRLPSDASSIIRGRAAQYLIPAMLPILSTAKNVNYFAHGGGAVCGAILGLILLRLWKHDEPVPPVANLLAVAGVAFIAVAAYSIYPIIELYGR